MAMVGRKGFAFFRVRRSGAKIESASPQEENTSGGSQKKKARPSSVRTVHV